MQYDNIHINLQNAFGYNKENIAIISGRNAGKTTQAWRYIYNQYIKNGYRGLVVRRLINDITDIYIGDIQQVINKFLPADKQIEFEFKKGSIKEGVVDVKIDGDVFFRVIALSNPLSRIKSLMLPNCTTILFDEFICNTRMGEKYLNDEAFRFKEIKSTFKRECPDGANFRCIFLGNPYSLYSPIISDFLNVPIEKLYQGSFYVAETYICWCYALSEELKKEILKKNPEYAFDESYKQYAFDGRAMNDNQIQTLPKQPQGWCLRFVFRFGQKYIGVFSRNYKNVEKDLIEEFESGFEYWISFLDNNYKSNRNIICFDANELIEGTFLLSNSDKESLQNIKNAYRFRRIKYRTIAEGYSMDEIYNYI